ncbi:MAG: sensor histidine kinase [Brevundimonas sp.]
MSMTSLVPSSDIALNLALSLISASVAPVLLLDGNLSIVAASQSFIETFDIGTEPVVGVRLADLGGGEWNTPPLWALLKATAYGQAAIRAYEMDLATPSGPRHLVLNAQRLVYGDGQGVRLLLSIQDVTELRARAQQKDDLIRDKAILIQEMRHRIANSLQIIASILLQGVRKFSSDESRDYLRDAHQRIMSVAAVQRQLSDAELGDVALRDYLTDLCRGVGDSMIRDHDRLTLSVTVDDSIVPSGKSVSLGLIVTELLINAIKHAFPEDRAGRITIDYRTQGEGWTLTVCDDGVGLPPDPSVVKPGLGAGIIRALAHQLGAVVVITDAEPGVRVSVVCAPHPLHTS